MEPQRQAEIDIMNPLRCALVFNLLRGWSPELGVAVYTHINTEGVDDDIKRDWGECLAARLGTGPSWDQPTYRQW